MKLDTPANESGRLAALAQYAVMDTPQESDFDDLTRLAAHICGTPMALISLLDDERQWFKSRLGVNVEQTPRDISFCTHALESDDLFIVPDAEDDARFAGTPLVAGDPHIRFYAGAPLVTPEGHALGTLCVMDNKPRDFTDDQQEALRILSRQVMTQLNLRRRARELAQRERLLTTIFDSEPECVTLLARDGSIRMINRAGVTMIGAVSMEQAATLTFCSLVDAPYRDALHTLMSQVFDGETGTLELTLTGLNGTTRWMEMHAAPLRNDDGVVTDLLGVTRDITERKSAEAAWRESEERYRTLYEYAPHGIVIADENSYYIDGNASICEMLGYTREEFIGLHASDIVSSKEVQHIAPALSVITSNAEYNREWEFKRKDGTKFDAEVIATMMPDGKLLGMIRDVTERKRTESRFRRLVESNAHGVLFWNTKGEIAGANDAFLNLVGYSRAELDAGELNWLAMTPPEFLDLDRRALEQMGKTGSCTPFEKEYFRKDGSRVPILLGAARFDDNEEEGVCFVLDLTERKKLEQQFLRAQRLESIGTLAGGIAHDLNNVLAPIIMSLELLQFKAEDKSSQELLAIMSTAAHRGADMVRQVLSFARGVDGRRMDVHIQHLVRDTQKIANETFLKHIEIRTNVAENLWTVNGEPTQLHQVLMNLCVNARDAMTHGGRITISAENLEIDAQHVGVDAEIVPGPYVLLQVEDNGTGMSPDIVEKIFDPFFTTKEIGKGTGLGMSTSMAIVKSHGGFIRVYSEPGEGTRIKVYLPAQTKRVNSGSQPVVPDLPRGNGEMVLVVDDEPSIRQVTQSTLEAFGYRVITAVDGADAVATYAARRGEIDVILTDMMMPVLDGPGAIQVLRKLNPTVRIIAASGLSAGGHSSQAAALGVTTFLAKPYNAATLLTLLSNLFNEERAAADA